MFARKVCYRGWAMVPFERYSPHHREELEALLRSRRWQRALTSHRVDDVRDNHLEPGTSRNFVDTAVRELVAANRDRARDLLAGGESDRVALLRELGRWDANEQRAAWPLSFVGLNLTYECNFSPRCIYCTQSENGARTSLSDWKRIIDEVTADTTDGNAPYIYLTGGEPLLLGEELWGEEGLVRHATARGARVNLNTNASMISPGVALAMVESGLAILHISLDTPDPARQNRLFGGNPKRFDRVLQGIYNVQIARELTGVSHPAIHMNCVLTRENFTGFPDLFRFLLSKHPQTADRDDPFFNDLLPHIIPVGGRDNQELRLTREEYRQFLGPIWEEVRSIWETSQEELGIEAEERRPLTNYFSNPYRRVEHEGGIEAYLDAASEGRYGALALAHRCYVAPTQAIFDPVGLQYRCGSHGVRRIHPIGNIAARGVFEAIRQSLPLQDQVPDEESCYGCALATLYINQSIEEELLKELDRLQTRCAPESGDDRESDNPR